MRLIVVIDTAWKEWLSADGDAQFFADLEAGLKEQFKIACRLLKMGLYVHCDLSVDRRPFNERFMKHVASTDLEVGASASRMEVIEVKSIRFPFGPGGKGHPFSTTFVGPVTHWEKKQVAGRVPTATIIVSQPTGNAFFVPTATKALWEITSIVDHRRGIPERNYAAPRNCWIDLSMFPRWICS